ncbi:LysR family transcriptional regulator [Celeribacter sp. HF31]|uniref:LysR substrate-binding domain-containing protein n=1 Tax=Celeribacter sp. HF31 TaxID=2721558 RepID=UPI00143007CF|nr:LysR substrate-binding domain-containing protein [Celeribacter sp. HF31]NIY80107.1 LysR family transcriptional regulator [Celeribacter sp. HF31]
MSPLPSLTALRTFEAAIRHGRMTRAADELGVTHGAISRQVRLLEETFGTQLLRRTHQGLLPTEAGAMLAEHLTRGFRDIEAGVAALRDEAGGTLDVSCLGTFTMRWLIPRLGRFAMAHPGIEVRLMQSDAPTDFSRGRYDVAIRVTDHALPEDAHVTRLFPERVGPVLSPGLAERLDLRTPADLNRAPRLWARTRPAAWADWCDHAGLGRLDGGAPYEHFYFMLEAAAAGLGVALAPEPHVADDLAGGRLVAPFGLIPSGLDYVAVRRRDGPRKARVFCDWVGMEAAG